VPPPLARPGPHLRPPRRPDPLRRHEGTLPFRRSPGSPPLPRRRRHHLRTRSQHRLPLRHRLPTLDRRRPPVHRRLPRRPPRLHRPSPRPGHPLRPPLHSPTFPTLTYPGRRSSFAPPLLRQILGFGEEGVQLVLTEIEVAQHRRYVQHRDTREGITVHRLAELGRVVAGRCADA